MLSLGRVVCSECVCICYRHVHVHVCACVNDNTFKNHFIYAPVRAHKRTREIDASGVVFASSGCIKREPRARACNRITRIFRVLNECGGVGALATWRTTTPTAEVATQTRNTRVFARAALEGLLKHPLVVVVVVGAVRAHTV